MTEREAATSGDRGTGWGQNRRLEFIDFRLMWEGRINRSDLTDFFGISIPQASLDLTRYQEMVPRNVEYDRSEKAYLATSEFDPLITPKDSSRFLNSLLAVNLEMMGREMSFIGWYPDFDAVLSPSRLIEPETLIRVLKAIRNRQRLTIEYQSMARAEPSSRDVSPHAIAYDGFRWHARAYCHEHNDFRDFVFARMLRIEGNAPSSVDSTKDLAWHTKLTLILEPHPDLSEAQRKAIALDYGMKDGTRRIEARQALLFYLLRRLGLREPAEKTAQAQQIVLKNAKELESYLRDIG